MKIKPIDRDVRSLFESHFFVIPRFQRPYSWDRENLVDFWTDICDATEDDYFIGSMVVYRQGQHAVDTNVVDGQQRLTTIVLLLCAIRDRLKLLGDEALALGLPGLIERPDLDNKKKYTLYSETPYPFLQDHIQKFGEPELKAEIGPEELALKAAYDEFCKRLDEKLDEVEKQPGGKKENKQKEKLNLLKNLRDRVLRLQTILIELDDEDDAYLIFETLNTRGKDLQPADLVKNHLTRLLRAPNSDNDVTREKWNKLAKMMGAIGSDIDLNGFLLHQWLSERDYVAEKRLFKEIKQTIGKGQAKAYLANLEDEAGLYRTIFQPQTGKWTKDDKAIQASLRALQVFRIRQAVPTVLALLRGYADKELTRAQLETALRKLENFHFVFTAVASQRGSGGLASMYSRAARDIRSASGKDGKQQAIKELISKLKERRPSNEEFLIGFQQTRFSDEYTRERQLVRYMLEKFDMYFGKKGRVIDYEQMTIEHIASQSAKDFSDEDIGSVGNLLFVPPKLNNAELAAKGFVGKMKLYAANDVAMDDGLAKAKNWDADSIVQRTVYLAEAYEVIWSL